jgi:hypothetical protein|tara:strand:- start:609 stop:1100 length:492 start_codon:yes stop_codon:yes gene_type:complete
LLAVTELLFHHGFYLLPSEGLEITLLHCHSKRHVLSEVEGSTYFPSVQDPRLKNLIIEISKISLYKLNGGAMMVKEGNKASDFCLSGLDKKREEKENFFLERLDESFGTFCKITGKRRREACFWASWRRKSGCYGCFSQFKSNTFVATQSLHKRFSLSKKISS